MTNILINNYALDATWCFDSFKTIIQSEMKVVVLPFSFRDDLVKNAQEADRYYAKGGKYYESIVNPLLKFGIKEENITILNYYVATKDDVVSELNTADILYFTGGLSDKTIERCKEKQIFEELKAFDKIVIGVGAGAMVQLDKFHITPDDDYEEYSYCSGIGYLDDFDIEVHYDCSYGKKMSIRRALVEEKKNIYAIGNQGSLLVEDGKISCIGQVELFKTN